MATLSIKVVPGARNSRVGGRYGDGFKVQVSVPPEDGKANRAVTEVLARALGLKVQQVTIVRGHTQPRKTVEIVGLDQAEAEARLDAIAR
jgi:uncharacterized protein (TIGR00251 family)